MSAMHNRRILTWLLALGALFSVHAQAASDTSAPSAQDEDFVRASLLTVSPGNDAVTCFGHAAIRMQCPSAGLDYSFTFEMKLDQGEQLKFLFGQAKAGFMVAQTGFFLEQYRKEGRGIHEYDLNLTPQQEQTLWRNLDQEVGQDARWDYDFIHYNCGSMCVWIVENALGDEHIEYGALPTALTGTYHETIMHVAKDAPWLNLFFHLRHFYLWNEPGEFRHKMSPEFLVFAWRHATLADSNGRKRPVLLADRELTPQTAAIHPPLLTPARTFIGIVIITILLLTLKNKQRMKKIFTSMSRRFLMAAVLTLTSALTALAGGDDWYAYKVQVEAYPTGAGVVYADTTEVTDESSIEYAASLDLEWTTKNTNCFGYAQAADGWQFIGFVKDTLDANGDVVRLDEVTNAPGEWTSYIWLDLDNGIGSKHFDEEAQQEVSDDSLTVAGLMPLDPNNYFRALFTHVAVQVNPEQTNMGTVSIDKLVNNIGDQVTLTATPASEFNSFVSWTLDDEVVSTEATLQVTVSGVANYVANFSDSRTLTLHFPDAGGFLEWYAPYDFALHYLADAYSPTIYDETSNNLLITSEDATSLNIVTSGYQVSGKIPSILYGFGDVTISPSSADEADDLMYGSTLFKWSGAEGINVADLDQENDKYYTFDASGVFTLITEGSIEANRLYMQLPDSMIAVGAPQPQIIYLNEEVATGIKAVPAAKAGNAQVGIFDLNGRRLDAIREEGIYILDGKKVIYRKK